ncbi:class I SAM-dependent methyltransferase [Methanococcus maripaludis]|jgi:SAM-dependent methyltransferase|uniref:Putative methyltransferase YcgJ n=1 Tax=Methanococcus maripaludis TaxID=39152 RepID=A0A2L1CCP8_METMI|nr:class I SAM-dependent methyltransferase [Methanococcus maripaludis]AVB77131.1 putative methyltransferase YcgJ [Methanococcus maripaludis]MBA2863643.1 SAM-dependent methyltransferase [Methanococcus maripaludis]MBB6496351.1 SAM-dependent methyltransferase [Methanococcus maripaludis]
MEKNFKIQYFEKYGGGHLPSKKYLIDILSKLPKNAKVLDVGCGKGTYLKEIHKIRPDLLLHAVDIGDVQEYLADYILFKKSCGDNLPFSDEMFDFVFCLHVLEHVQNPHEFMIEFNRVLKKDGFTYIEMPYYKRAYIPDGNMNFWSDPTHIRPYNHNSVDKLLIENGFETLKIKLWRDWIPIFLGPYLILKRILFNDMDALSTFFANLYGCAIGGLGKKVKNIK